jgi:hypothetical protein
MDRWAGERGGRRGLLARAIANRPFRQIFGLGGAARSISIRRSTSMLP